MGERSTGREQPGYEGLCNYAQKFTSCFGLDGHQGTMPTLPNLNSLGKLCSSNRSHSVSRSHSVNRSHTVNRSHSVSRSHSANRSHSISRSHSANRIRVKRKSSVKRMSIIEDGHVAEVLYLIPKQYMELLPFLNPNDYYLSERLNDVPSAALLCHTNSSSHLDAALRRRLTTEGGKGEGREAAAGGGGGGGEDGRQADRREANPMLELCFREQS
ncbi:hypothetical protein FQA47_022912 [Oryzias melastigma]|uniref:Uncharacterized protein n=1 Tax=Oryzias melastigma TaxID=30732 RepID=A0A834CDC9_ORYME|nr:hypothetical protein FQA47_022912 [Oryzias melastigma]